MCISDYLDQSSAAVDDWFARVWSTNQMNSLFTAGQLLRHKSISYRSNEKASSMLLALLQYVLCTVNNEIV